MVDAGRAEISAHFQIRKNFILTRLKILQYSRVSNLTAIVGIDTAVQGSPLLLGIFEEGGTKEPDNGSGIAVPITGSPARPTFSDAVVRALQYTKLQLSTTATDQSIRGLQHTYVVPGVGVFERVAPGNDPGATVLIYAFEPSAPLKKRISLIQVMSDIVSARFNPIFWQEYANEIAQQKPAR